MQPLSQDPQRDIVDVTVNGLRYMLDACKREAEAGNFSKFVLTSSQAAMLVRNQARHRTPPPPPPPGGPNITLVTPPGGGDVHAVINHAAKNSNSLSDLAQSCVDSHACRSV